MTPEQRVDSPAGVIVDEPRFHDEALMPVRMGTPYRVPDYAYPNWGLSYRGEGQADAAYRAEWGAGNAGQLALVTQATIEAGLGDYPELLRKKTAEVVSGIMAERTEPIRILDIGAGPGRSALMVYDALPPDARTGTEITLVDPSSESLDEASGLFSSQGIEFQILPGSDSEVLPNLDRGTFDVVTGVASVHHHARIPFEMYYRVLQDGGFLVLADWHQPLWEHPGSVLQFLEQMDWPRKEEGLEEWLRVYPNASSAPPLPKNPADRQAIVEITKFWKAYQRISREANLGPNAIWPLEGHRPVGRYVLAMRQAGFDFETQAVRELIRAGVIDRNPHQIRPDSSLLQVTIGQKIE